MPVPGTRSLIVSDYSSVIQRVEDLLKLLDSDAAVAIEFVRLKEADAREVVTMLTQLLAARQAAAAGTGTQPMLSADGMLVLVFNGEIYNFVELRVELASLGHVFKSSGDTEVLLHDYMEWGTGCFEKLNGMWAFAWYRAAKKEIILCRDHFGIKPLYYTRSNDFRSSSDRVPFF